MVVSCLVFVSFAMACNLGSVFPFFFCSVVLSWHFVIKVRQCG